MSERPGVDHGAPPASRPPLGSWGRLYGVVIAVLVLDLVLLAWLTGHYR